MQVTRRAVRAAQAGFTLIELVIVILIIGILAAVVIPQFTDVSNEAKLSTLKGTAGAIASATATQYALRQANTSLTPVTSCANAFALVTPPSDVNIASGGTAPASAGATGSCVLTYTGGTPSYTFTIVGA